MLFARFKTIFGAQLNFSQIILFTVILSNAACLNFICSFHLYSNIPSVIYDMNDSCKKIVYLFVGFLLLIEPLGYTIRNSQQFVFIELSLISRDVPTHSAREPPVNVWSLKYFTFL